VQPLLLKRKGKKNIYTVRHVYLTTMTVLLMLQTQCFNRVTTSRPIARVSIDLEPKIRTIGKNTIFLPIKNQTFFRKKICIKTRMSNHCLYLSPKIICSNNFLFFETSLCILWQLRSRFTLTCNNDFTVFSLRLFLL